MTQIVRAAADLGELGVRAELNALLSGAGVAPASQTAWITVTGQDRVRWLNGMVTNSVQQLPFGSGCYTFLLSAQGRIQGDAYVFAEEDRLLLRTDREQVEKLLSQLDRFIIMDDVEVQSISSGWSGLHLSGPQTAALLHQTGLDTNGPTPGIARLSWQGAEVSLIRLHSPFMPHLELWSDPANIDRVAVALIQAGASAVNEESLEQLRILEGTPRYGADIRDRELPQETGQTHALHFAKGCYLGQEIVERIRSRGAVHRIFSGFKLEGELPISDLLLYSEGKKVGELTTSTEICLETDASQIVRLALGYALREVLDRGAPLTYSGGVAVPVALPYPPARDQHPS